MAPLQSIGAFLDLTPKEPVTDDSPKTRVNLGEFSMNVRSRVTIIFGSGT
jgi:hypothetical protein